MLRVNLLGLAALTVVVLVSYADAGTAPKLSPAETKAVYKAAGLTEGDGKILDTCGKAIEPQVDVVDLNNDGQPEVFVLATDAICYGDAGGSCRCSSGTSRGTGSATWAFRRAATSC